MAIRWPDLMPLAAKSRAVTRFQAMYWLLNSCDMQFRGSGIETTSVVCRGRTYESLALLNSK